MTVEFMVRDKRGDNTKNKNAFKSLKAVPSCLKHTEWEGRNAKPSDQQCFIRTEKC